MSYAPFSLAVTSDLVNGWLFRFVSHLNPILLPLQLLGTVTNICE